MIDVKIQSVLCQFSQSMQPSTPDWAGLPGPLLQVRMQPRAAMSLMQRGDQCSIQAPFRLTGCPQAQD